MRCLADGLLRLGENGRSCLEDWFRFREKSLKVSDDGLHEEDHRPDDRDHGLDYGENRLRDFDYGLSLRENDRRS
jgi:hypothetical protein